MRSIVRAPLVFVASIALVLMSTVVAATPAAAAASLSLDQSTPASVKKTGTTLTTAIFTPPAGSVLVISVQTNGSNNDDVKSIAGRIQAVIATQSFPANRRILPPVSATRASCGDDR